MMYINKLGLICQKKVLLHPISFKIKPKKLYALIGHNGLGKSSLIKAITLTQIDAFRDRQVSTLSGGERARVWLAMCLVQQTDFLLLDEPLAALDVVYQVEVLKLICQLVDEQGLGVVVILHDLNLAARFCDELIALKQGKLCHMSDVSSTMQQEVLHSIFGVDFTLLIHPATNHKVAVI